MNSTFADTYSLANIGLDIVLWRIPGLKVSLTGGYNNSGKIRDHDTTSGCTRVYPPLLEVALATELS